jgi:hypothetical protein
MNSNQLIKSEKRKPRVKDSPKMMRDLELSTAGAELDDMTAEEPNEAFGEELIDVAAEDGAKELGNEVKDAVIPG